VVATRAGYVHFSSFCPSYFSVMALRWASHEIDLAPEIRWLVARE